MAFTATALDGIPEAQAGDDLSAFQSGVRAVDTLGTGGAFAVPRKVAAPRPMRARPGRAFAAVGAS